tara:strand:+ start:1744 stop:5316 length:3573 start_codon:yes stop_codon:yes gene_type:complete
MVDRIKGEEVEALYQEFVNDDKIDPNTAQKNISEAILQSPQFNLSEEEINAFRQEGPNKVFETFTTMKSRGKTGAFFEGAGRGLAAYTPAGYAGLAAGKGVMTSPLPLPPQIKIPLAIGTGLVVGGLTAVGFRGATEAVLPEATYLPDEKAYRTAGDTASAILNPSSFLGTNSVRGLLSKIPEDVNFGGNLIRARINPLQEKITRNLATQNPNAKSSKVIEAVRGAFTTLPDELILRSSQASATVRDLAQIVASAAGKSAKNPKRYALGETVFAVPPTIGAGMAEEANPGELGTRILYETLGGGVGLGLPVGLSLLGAFTDNARSLVTLLPDEIKFPFIGNKKFTFVKNEKDRQAANYIVNKLKDYAKQEGKTFNFDSFIKDLNQNIPERTLNDLASLNLSPGLVAKEFKNPLIALERQLAANDNVFAKALKDQTDERLRAINATINTLYATGDDNALKLASALYRSRVQTLLNAKLQRALDKTDKTLEKFTNLPEAEIKDKANKLLVQNIDEVIKNWRKVEDGAWDKTLSVIGKEQITPEDTLSFFKTVTDAKTGKAKINLSRYQNPKTGKLQGMDPYVINFVNKLRGGGKFTLNELKIDRSTILELSKREKNPTLRGFYGRLAENIYEDYTKPIPNMNPQAKVSFDQAKQISKVGNDLFKRTFITDATKQNVEGKSIVSPELLLEKAIFSGGSKARLNYEDLRQGFNVIGKLLRKKEGQPITAENVGQFVPDEEITDVMAMLNKETGYNQDYDTALNLILNDLLVKERVIKSIPVDTTFAKQIGTDVSEQEKITKKIIDPVKLEEFLNNDLTKVLLDLSPFKTLEKDLRIASEQGTDLQKSLNYLKKLVSQKSAQNTALVKAFGHSNPSLAIDTALNSPQPLEQFNFYADLINKAAKKNNDPTIKDAFTSYVIDYILTKSSDPVTKTVLPTPVKAYLNDPIEQLYKLGTGATINVKLGPQTSILQVLKQKNIISDDYLKDFNKSITQLETIEDYLRAVLPESEFMGGGSMEFLGRFIGARVAPSGTIQVPAQFAKLGKQFFSDIPQAVLSSRLKESLLPGNIKEFISTLDKASEITKRGVGRVLADNFVNYFRRVLSPSIRLPIQEISEEDISIISPASARSIPKRKPLANAIPIPKRKPLKKKVSEANIPPRPTITAPPAQEVAQANLGPFNPETLARMEQLDRLVG